MRLSEQLQQRFTQVQGQQRPTRPEGSERPSERVQSKPPYTVSSSVRTAQLRTPKTSDVQVSQRSIDRATQSRNMGVQKMRSVHGAYRAKRTSEVLRGRK